MSRSRPASAASVEETTPPETTEEAASVEETTPPETTEEAASVEETTPPDRIRALIDVPALALGAPGTVAVRGDDGAWIAQPVGT